MTWFIRAIYLVYQGILWQCGGGWVIYPSGLLCHTTLLPPFLLSTFSSFLPSFPLLSLPLSLINQLGWPNSSNNKHSLNYTTFPPPDWWAVCAFSGYPHYLAWLKGKSSSCALKEWETLFLFQNVATNESHVLCIQTWPNFSLYNLRYTSFFLFLSQLNTSEIYQSFYLLK